MICNRLRDWWVDTCGLFLRDSALNYQLGYQDALTADAVENFLRQNEFPVLVDKGGMCRKLSVFEFLN
jgi:hypothetical protein